MLALRATSAASFVAKSIAAVAIIVSYSPHQWVSADDSAEQSDVLQQLSELWESQRGTISSGEIKFDFIRAGEVPGFEAYSGDAFREKLAAIIGPDGLPADCEKALTDIVGYPVTEWQESRFVFDGSSRREETGDLQVVHEEVHAVSDLANNQVSIHAYPSRLGVLQFRDFRLVPSPELTQNLTLEGDTWSLSSETVALSFVSERGDRFEYEFDANSGHLYRRTYFSGESGLPVEVLVQSDFRTLPDGAQMPFCRLEIRFRDGEPAGATGILIRSMSANMEVDGSEFQVAVPAGRGVFDYRRDEKSPSYFLVEKEVPDVVEYVDDVLKSIQ